MFDAQHRAPLERLILVVQAINIGRAAAKHQQPKQHTITPILPSTAFVS
jgi:hypothetical protein